jgi:hypothetical protein
LDGTLLCPTTFGSEERMKSIESKLKSIEHKFKVIEIKLKVNESIESKLKVN